jgi:integrase
MFRKWPARSASIQARTHCISRRGKLAGLCGAWRERGRSLWFRRPSGVDRGFKMANDGIDTRTIQAYLGHKEIRHTVRYTELSPIRFKGLWKD